MILQPSHRNEVIFSVVFILLFSSQVYGQTPHFIRDRQISCTNDSILHNTLHPWEQHEYSSKSTHNSTFTDNDVTIVGQWAWGNCQAVAVQGHYAFIGNGLLFQVVDISDSKSPSLVGELMVGGAILDIAIRDNVAYVVCFDKLDVVDILIPSTPKLLSRLNRYIYPGKLAVFGNYLLIGNEHPSIEIFDISESINPQFLTTYYATGYGGVFDMKIYEEYLYVIAYDSRVLEIVDISNPTLPKRAGLFEMNDWMNVLSVSGHYLLVGTYLDHSIHILDIFTPTEPVRVSTLNVGYIPGDIKISGNHAFVTTDHSRFVAVDISNVSHPYILSDISGRPTPYSFDMITAGEHVYIPWNIGLWIINVESPDSPEEASFFPTGNYAWKTEICGDYAYIADGLAGLWILDITNRSKPIEVANFPTETSARDIIIDDTLFYLMEEYDLWIGDISDPKCPQQIGHWSGVDIMRSIAHIDNFIFTVTRAGLTIINVSDPAHPVLACYSQFDSLYDVKIVDTIAFLADLDDGLRVIDVSDPYDPQEIGSLLLPYSDGLEVEGNLAYISAQGGLTVVDISEPSVPSELGFVHTEGGRSGTVDVSVLEEIAYMAYGHDLPIIDVSNPNSPEVIYHHRTTYGASGINTLSDSSILLSCGYAGIYIYQTNIPTSIIDNQEESIIEGFHVFQNYPNPFNKSTVVRYSLPRNSAPVYVRLKVFNILGQEITTLVEEMKVGGHYSVNWNGKDASGNVLTSGIYIYSLETDVYQCVKSMILLR